MFFVASKVLWFLTGPVNALLFALTVAFVLSATGFRRAGGVLTGAATLALLLIGFSPVAALVLRPLEDRFPQCSAEDTALTGIVVLGGSIDTTVSAARGQVALRDAATRVTMAVGLARRYPEARLVFSGGSGLLVAKGDTEADDTRRLWLSLGVAADRITIEDRSRNTYENALFTERLIQPKPDERWLLVTSAYHMPRSVGLFRAVGFPVTPCPVDYLTTDGWPDLLPPSDATMNFRQFGIAAREWIGLVAYRLTGKINQLFPGP